MATIHDLPFELRGMILDHLEDCDQFVCKHVNREWRTVLLKDVHASPWFLYQLAERGRLDQLKWARANIGFCTWSERVPGVAAANGHLDVLKWLKGNGVPWDDQVCIEAAAGGHVDVLKWLDSTGAHRFTKYRHWRPKKMIAGAAEGGHAEVLEWIHGYLEAKDQEVMLGEAIVENAVSAGHIAVLPWLLWLCCRKGKEACNIAARNGRLDILEWLWQHDRPWGRKTCRAAVSGGHLDVLVWLRDRGCPWDAGTCLEAAALKEPDVLISGPRARLPLETPNNGGYCRGQRPHSHPQVAQGPWLLVPRPLVGRPGDPKGGFFPSFEVVGRRSPGRRARRSGRVRRGELWSGTDQRARRSGRV